MRLSIVSLIKSILVLVFLGCIAIGGYLAYSKLPSMLNEINAKSEPVAPGKEVIVTIPKGASLSQVGAVLQEQGIVSSRFVFKIVAFLRGEQRKIKAGDYALKTGSDAGDVLDLLTSGKTLMFTITVPEGYDMFQVAELFHQNGITDRKDFLKLAQDKAFLKELGISADSIEGYLFPDTYYFRYSEKNDPKLIMTKMVQHFQNIYDKNVKPIAEQNGLPASRVVTLASLVEKEARALEHRLVSSVFHNRLRQNMKLQTDPTVIYGIKPMGSKITYEDLNRKHPYNTYQNKGLPPGPICNPGKESLVAAVNPAESDYLYFVAKNDGTHEFSTDLKEHNKNVDKFQRQPRSKLQ
jgi:UPF0755 protein